MRTKPELLQDCGSRAGQEGKHFWHREKKTCIHIIIHTRQTSLSKLAYFPINNRPCFNLNENKLYLEVIFKLLSLEIKGRRPYWVWKIC